MTSPVSAVTEYMQYVHSDYSWLNNSFQTGGLNKQRKYRNVASALHKMM